MKRVCVLALCVLLLLMAAAGGREPDPQPQTTSAVTSARAARKMHPLQRSTEEPAPTTAAPKASGAPSAAATTTGAPRTTYASAAATSAAETTRGQQHSPLYLPGYTADDVIRWFDEVALSSEYSTGEDTQSLLRWESEIRYCLHGSYMQEDADWLAGIFKQLNAVEGFPGARRVQDEDSANMNLYFCDRDEFHDRMYDSVPDDNADGATTYYYNGANHITSATICYWEDMSASVRRSVMTEEIINSVGFSNDTTERENSVVYQYGSWTEEPDKVDWLLLRLIYAPEMRAGMRRAEAEKVIRKLYY